MVLLNPEVFQGVPDNKPVSNIIVDFFLQICVNLNQKGGRRWGKVENSKIKKKEEEIEEMKKLSKIVGVEDLMFVYEEYQKLMQIATQYLNETVPKATFLTTNNTSY